MNLKEFLKSKFRKVKYFDGQVKIKKVNKIDVDIPPVGTKVKVTINPNGDKANE